MPRLRLRDGVFYYRVKLPGDLRRIIGRPELSYSLRTGDPHLAEVRVLELSARQLRLYRAVRQASRVMTSDEITDLVRRYMESFRENREADAMAFGRLSPEAAQGRVHWLSVALQDAEQALVHNDLASTERLAEEILGERGIAPIDPDTFRRLTYRLLTARVDVLREDARRMPSTAAPPGPTPASPLLSALVKDYLAHRDTSDAYRKKTRIEAVAAFAAMVDLLGDKPINSVRNRDAQGFALKFGQLPQRWRQSNRGKTATEVIVATEGTNVTRIAPATFNKEMGLIKAFWTWACLREELPSNAFDAVSPAEIGNTKGKRKSFTEEDMQRIAPVIAEARATWPARYWIATLLAYSGARLAEIAQLRKQDIFEAEGIWCIHITDEAGSLKNDASERDVPIHSAVIAKGFLEFIQGAPAGYLFASQEGEGRDGQPISKWFSRLLTNLALPERAKKGLHSFRHTMRDRLLRAGVDGVTRREILGHAHEDVEDQVYGDPTGMTERKEALERVSLPV